MPYNVFLVEDEIVTREGIRDRVNWEAAGFRFCGEASDGELALPLLETTRPDVLITDIRMPFMDGLQLSKFVRERMPGVKIIILSGHDEFEYAQAAIQLGVTEYLLKPVSVQDLQGVLQRVAAQLARERQQQAGLAALQAEIVASREALRQGLYLKLVLGTIASAEAIEQGQALDIDLVARWYAVALVQTTDSAGEQARAGQVPLSQAVRSRRRLLQEIVTAAAGHNPDVFLLQKSEAEIVLILKGHVPEYLREEGDYLLGLIRRQAQAAGCPLTMGIGAPKPHLRELYRSFAEALTDLQSQGSSWHPGDGANGAGAGAGRAELLQVDKSAVDNFLRYGVQEDFDAFFAALIRPFDGAAQRSPLVKNYLMMNVIVAAGQFVHELGGDIAQVVPDLGATEELLTVIQTVAEMRAPAQKILLGALAFRDSYLNQPYAAMMRQVKQYIAQHYGDPNLSLQEVARQINLSPNHFSMVFGQEAGATFKSYLTEIRMDKARQLLRATTLRPSEIAAQVGYNDSHYFSAVFRKQTGLTPTEFRAQPQGV
jgi:two-component system response regulator YesN